MATNPFSLSDYVRAASPAPSFAPAPASPVPPPLEEPEPAAAPPAPPEPVVAPAPVAAPALDVGQPQVARPRAGVYTPETVGELKAAFGDGPLPKGYELFEIEEPTTGERNYFLNYDEELRKAQIAEETPGGITGTLKTVGSVPLRGAAKTAELIGSVSGAVTDLGTRAVESGAESLNIPFVPELARGVRETEKAVRETVLAPAVRLREWAESWGTTVDPERRDMGFFDSVATGLDERGEGGFEAYARSTIQTLGNVAADLVTPMKGLGAATGAAAKGLKLGKTAAAALGKYGSVIPFATEGIVEREKQMGRDYSPALSAAEGFMNAATMLPVYSSLLGKEAIRGVAPGAVAGLKAWSEGMLRDFGSNALAFTAMRAGTVPFKQGPEGFMERMKDALDPRANLEAAAGAFSLSPFHAARVAKAVREGRTMDARDALLRALPAEQVLLKMRGDPKFDEQVLAQAEALVKARGDASEEALKAAFDEVLATQIAVIRQEQDKLGNLSDAVMEDNAHAKTAAAAVADAAARGSDAPAAEAFREWLVENPPDVGALHRDVLAQRDRQTAAEPVAEPAAEPAAVRTAEPSAAETLRTDLPAELAAEQTRVNDLFRNARALIESGANPAAVEAAQVEATRADIALQKRIGIFDQARAGAPGAPPLLPEDRPRNGIVVTGPSAKPEMTNEQFAAQMEADIPRIRAEWAAKLAAMQARLSEGSPEAEAAARPVEPVAPEAAPAPPARVDAPTPGAAVGGAKRRRPLTDEEFREKARREDEKERNEERLYDLGDSFTDRLTRERKSFPEGVREFMRDVFPKLDISEKEAVRQSILDSGNVPDRGRDLRDIPTEELVESFVRDVIEYNHGNGPVDRRNQTLYGDVLGGAPTLLARGDIYGWNKLIGQVQFFTEKVNAEAPPAAPVPEAPVAKKRAAVRRKAAAKAARSAAEALPPAAVVEALPPADRTALVVDALEVTRTASPGDAPLAKGQAEQIAATINALMTGSPAEAARAVEAARATAKPRRAPKPPVEVAEQAMLEPAEPPSPKAAKAEAAEPLAVSVAVDPAPAGSIANEIAKQTRRLETRPTEEERPKGKRWAMQAVDAIANWNLKGSATSAEVVSRLVKSGVSMDEVKFATPELLLDPKRKWTKAELVKAVRDSGFVEETLGGERREGYESPQYPEYVLPGEGRGYEERLVYFAPRGKKPYYATHFGELGENLLFHFRFDIRELPDGRKILVLQEVQSDIHQEARGREGIPDAPLKDTWHEKAFLRAMQIAAERGLDGIAWTTGDQQIRRWGLPNDTSWPRELYDARLGGTADRVGRQTGASRSFVDLIVPSERETEIRRSLDAFGQFIAEAGLDAARLDLMGEGRETYENLSETFPDSVKKILDADLAQGRTPGNSEFDRYAKAWFMSEGLAPRSVSRLLVHFLPITEKAREMLARGVNQFSRSGNGRLGIAVRAENAGALAPTEESAAQAADLLARSVARYSKDINVLIYKSPAEDPAFRGTPEADRPRGAAYYEPAAETITFYTDRLRMDTAQKAAAVHEVAHMGIRKLVGEANASRFFEALYSKLPRDLMQEIERRYGGPAKNAIDRINQAQELVARYAERLVRNGTLRPTEMSWFRRLVVRPLKNLLRKAFNNPMFGGWDEYDIALFAARGLRKLRSYRADDTATGADSRLLDRDANVADIINIMTAKGESLEMRAGVTDSPEFRRWFGDSKVVDENGEPLVVYHGTNADFEAFRPSNQGTLGPGIYFAYEEKGAREWAGTKTRGSQFGRKTIPVYLSVKNPFVIDNTVVAVEQLWNKFGAQKDSDLIPLLKAAGYDGVIAKGSAKTVFGETSPEIMVFDPTQIKSVNNRGTWDPFKESILEMRRTPEEELDDLSAYYRDLKQARDGRGVSERANEILRDTLARFGIRKAEATTPPAPPAKPVGERIMDMAVREGEKTVRDFAPENLRPLPEPMSKPFIMGPDGKEIRNPDYKTTLKRGGVNEEQVLRHFQTYPSDAVKPEDLLAHHATQVLSEFARLRGEPDVATNKESLANAVNLGEYLERTYPGETGPALVNRLKPLVNGDVRAAQALLGLTAGKQIQKLMDAMEAVRKNPDDPMLKAYLGSVRMNTAAVTGAWFDSRTESARIVQLQKAVQNEMLRGLNPVDALKFKTWEKIFRLQNANSDLDLMKIRMLEEAVTKHADDLPALMDAIRKIEPATLMEQLVEGYAMNNLGFKSNGKNLVSNTLMAGYNLGLVYPAVDLVEAIRTGSMDPLKAGWARTKGWFRPVIRTVTDTQAFLGAVAKFADIMMERTHVQSGVSEPMGKIGGNLGRIIRWGGNLNSAADYMFKSLAFNAAVSEWAYVETSRMAAEAAKKGRTWTPEQFAAELASRTNNPSLAGVERGTLMQNYFTFQDALDRQGIVGAFGTAAQGVKRQIPIIGFLLPYVKTPTNLLAFFYRATPIGAVDTLRERTALGLKMTDMVMNAITGEMRNRLQEAKDTGVFSSEVERRISEEVIVHSMLGLAGFVAGTYLAATGRMTGMATDADERRRMDESELGGEGRIRIGDTVFAYDALDPFSTIVSAGAGFYNSYTAKQEELRKRGAEFAAKGSKVPAAAQMNAQDIAGVLGSSLSTMLRSTVKQGIGETYLTSPRQFLDAIDDDSAGGTRAFKFLRNVAGSTFIPLAAPLRELSQANDPYLRDINSRLLTYGPGASMADYLKANIPFAGRETLPPVYKTVGEAKPNYRRNPYWFGPANMDRIGNELSRLNAVPMDVTPMFRRLGLTPEELEFANQTRGQLVKTALGRLINSPGYSRATDDARSKAVRRTIEQINNTVERRILLARRRAGMESPR